ncbi:CvpA family protein [Hymenobacter busanensis]|uniref:CvpA family protein n=1 Tax=Hymenobacter busanensis TaxID=2607656 RepID=A0A7L5A0S2_9BACT|nr:CvpA family protein [Hymenobacter busanensis]KAA9331532.1 CvpA family protein [Hymenobacter busanensis]QHJ08686.1 CvpA family protein [Hymenobacter busanensis]
MSGFDLLLLMPLAVGAVKGFRRGIVMEIVSLVAFVLGLIGGLKLLGAAIPLVRHYVGEAFGMLPLVSFVLVFALLTWGVHLVGGMVRSAIHLTPLGVLDHILGGAVGVVKWVLGLSLLLYFTGLGGLPIGQQLTHDSMLLPIVQQATPVALNVVGVVLPFAKELLSTLRNVF